MIRRMGFFGSVLSSLACAASCAASAGAFHIVEIPSPPELAPARLSFNSYGQIFTGQSLWQPDSSNATTGQWHALFSAGSEMTGGRLNDDGWIVTPTKTFVPHTRNAPAGGLIDWGTFSPVANGRYARDSGTMLELHEAPSAAFPAGRMFQLGSPAPGETFYVYDINRYGQILGFQSINLQDNDPLPVVLWTPDEPGGVTGRFTELTALPRTLEGELELAENGNVLYSALYTQTNDRSEAFLWTPDQPNGTTGSVRSVNEIVAQDNSAAFTFANHGYLYFSVVDPFEETFAEGLVWRDEIVDFGVPATPPTMNDLPDVQIRTLVAFEPLILNDADRVLGRAWWFDGTGPVTESLAIFQLPEPAAALPVMGSLLLRRRRR